MRPAAEVRAQAADRAPPDRARPGLRAAELVFSVRRALTAAVVGVAGAGLVAVAGEPALAPVVGWLIAAGLVLVWVWRRLWPMDHAGTKRLAELESETRTTDTAILAGAVGSLGLVVLALVRSAEQRGAAATATVILCVVAVVASWAMVNTVFALKYARHYYFDDDGGIDFKQGDPPAYSDFAYLAFSVGMAFQAAETEPLTTALRKVVLGHALLSYAFGTGILAVAINLVTNLGQS